MKVARDFKSLDKGPPTFSLVGSAVRTIVFSSCHVVAPPIGGRGAREWSEERTLRSSDRSCHSRSTL